MSNSILSRASQASRWLTPICWSPTSRYFAPGPWREPPPLAILVTHAHPDHFNGALGLVKDKEAPVYATASVGRVIEEIADAKRAQWTCPRHERPAETYYPTRRWPMAPRSSSTRRSFTVREVGPEVTHADSYLPTTADRGATAAFTVHLASHGRYPRPRTAFRRLAHRARRPRRRVLACALCNPGTARPARACPPTSGAT